MLLLLAGVPASFQQDNCFGGVDWGDWGACGALSLEGYEDSFGKQLLSAQMLPCGRGEVRRPGAIQAWLLMLCPQEDSQPAGTSGRQGVCTLL